MDHSDEADLILSHQQIIRGRGTDTRFNRAKEAWVLAKAMGLEFPGTDELAIQGLELELDRIIADR